MGHGAAKEDNRASLYNAARVSTELAYKSNIAANVQAGWRPVEEGANPEPPLCPLGVVSPPTTAVPLAARSERKAKAAAGSLTLPPVSLGTGVIPPNLGFLPSMCSQRVM